MKQLLIAGWLSLVNVLAASAADPIFINDNPVISPPDNAPVINATAWVNRAPFDITILSGFNHPLPFESQNTRFFTNTSTMVGNPGYRFWYNVGPNRLWMDTWTNNGTIATDNALTFSNTLGTSFTTFFGFNSQASILQVQSTNIASTGAGTLRSGAQGIIHLEGKNVNLKRNGLRTGSVPQSSFFFSGGFLLSSNYQNDFGIFDKWWGVGTKNTLNGQGPGMRIDNLGGSPQFTLPAPSSPNHQVIEVLPGGFPATVIESLPRRFNATNYTAAVWTNQTGPTNFIIQVVFYPTNNVDTNFTTDVQFVPDFFGVSGAS